MRTGKPLLENIFGENNTIKVLDFLVMGSDFDFTLTHISNGTGLSRTAVRNAINTLIKKGLVIKSRSDDKSDYFKINQNNDKFKLIEKLYEKVMNDVLTA